jgi:hypothetical protein
MAQDMDRKIVIHGKEFVIPPGEVTSINPILVSKGQQQPLQICFSFVLILFAGYHFDSFLCKSCVSSLYKIESKFHLLHLLLIFLFVANWKRLQFPLSDLKKMAIGLIFTAGSLVVSGKKKNNTTKSISLLQIFFSLFE